MACHLSRLNQIRHEPVALLDTVLGVCVAHHAAAHAVKRFAECRAILHCFLWRLIRNAVTVNAQQAILLLVGTALREDGMSLQK